LPGRISSPPDFFNPPSFRSARTVFKSFLFVNPLELFQSDPAARQSVHFSLSKPKCHWEFFSSPYHSAVGLVDHFPVSTSINCRYINPFSPTFVDAFYPSLVSPYLILGPNPFCSCFNPRRGSISRKISVASLLQRHDRFA